VAFEVETPSSSKTNSFFLPDPYCRSSICNCQNSIGFVTFLVDKPQADSTVEITQILVGNFPVPMNTPVSVPSDWYDKMSVVVTNLSSKSIVYGAVVTLFPESVPLGTNGPILTDVFAAGKRPLSTLLRTDGSHYPQTKSELDGPAFNIKSGASFSLQSSGGTPTAVEQATKMSGRPVTQVKIEVNVVYFSDGSKCASGRFCQRPGSTPGSWDRIPTNDYFASPAPGH
jgi:hypothetical protein